MSAANAGLYSSELTYEQRAELRKRRREERRASRQSVSEGTGGLRTYGTLVEHGASAQIVR